MRKRVLSFLLAASAAFCFIFSSAPEAHAIVPIGLVQSALASYVASAGYKLWNDNGTGQEILKSLSDLYDGPFLAYAESTLGVNIEVNDLSYYAANDMVYQDNSGQIVVRKAAADMFQQFADWIETEYSVPVGSDTPTEVVQSSAGSYSNANGSWIILQPGITYSYSANPVQNTNFASVSFTVISSSSPVYFWGVNNTSTSASSGIFGLQSASSFSYNYVKTDSSGSSSSQTYNGTYYSSYSCYYSLRQAYNAFPSVPYFSLSAPSPWSVFDDAVESGGVAALGVTLAQAVADVVGQAKEDDAVVIGVGASAGATAQDIADMVAQGIKAQTLNPSVSITAEAVIDTPVQPYPDIGGLGLPTLGAALVDRFPFCIPWDFVDTVRLLSADPQPINIKVDLIPQRIKTAVGISSDTSFDIDLSGEQYAKIGVFCRWGSLIGFCFGLFLLTKRLVWTA